MITFKKTALPERATKIIATIGPATAKATVQKKLIDEGMDFARFNFSHGNHEEFSAWAKSIRDLARRLKRKVEIIQDLQGPRVRVGQLPAEGKHIVAGHQIKLTFGEHDEHKRGEIQIQSDIEPQLKKGDHILMDNGLVDLEVKKITGETVVCKALTGGQLFTGKGVNLPNSEIKTGLTEKDLADIKHGLAMNYEWMALSFVEGASDITALREITGNKVKIIAKIERPQAIKNYVEILEAADAVMIARGDLGIEIPFWKLPIIQKRAIRRARTAGKPSIVATDMMASMTVSPRPSRAEVLDVANAVLDGASAVMLSNETAVGKHPLDAVVAMRKIVEETEVFAKSQELQSLLG